MVLCDKVLEKCRDDSYESDEEEDDVFKDIDRAKKSRCIRSFANIFPEEITKRFIDSKFNKHKLDCPESDGDFDKDAAIENCQVSDCKGWRKNFFCTVSD